MKKTITLIFLFLGLVSQTFTQEIDYSVYLASGDGVYSNPSSVTDNNGCTFVIGATRNGLQFTFDAFQKKYSGYNTYGGGDMFLMKLSPTGELMYSTYIGGSGSDYLGEQLILDDSDNVYIAFSTYSKDLPVSNDAYQKSHNKGRDYYVIKFDNDCKYLASTYLGGSKDDSYPRLAINNTFLYVIGTTQSEDFPSTKNVIQEKYNNWTSPNPSEQRYVKDITITVLSLNLNKLYHSTYLGGKNSDEVTSYNFSENGNLIISGTTYSDDFPITQNGFDCKLDGKKDGFVTVIKPDLSKIVYSTLIGGSADDNINYMDIYDSDILLLTGSTTSKDFPITSEAISDTLNGDKDGFVLKINIKTGKLFYSSYLGGTGSDTFSFIAKTKDQKYVLIGESNSVDFPVTENAWDKIQNGPVYKTHSSDWFSVTEDEILYDNKEDLVIVILDKTLSKIDFSSFIGGCRDDAWSSMYTANLSKGNQLHIATLTESHDFPVTDNYAKYPGSPRVILLKINLNGEKSSQNKVVRN